jgi:hypothetical protein
MKRLIAIAFATSLISVRAEEPIEQHRQATAKIADHQDELSADVQQIRIEQTSSQVIELLDQVRTVMNEATDQLAASDTGGKTIAAQTEVIEKIHAAAKEKQKQSGGSQSGGAMLKMMEHMMGEKSDSPQSSGAQPGDAGEKAGETGQGTGAAAGDQINDSPSAKDDTRRIPKASGEAGRTLPDEFQQALEAYNRGLEKKVK